LCISLFSVSLAGAAPVSISADAAIIMDATTGEVLFEKNTRRQMAPASTTKILTAIVALERGNLQDIVTVSRKAAYTEGSSVYLAPGEKISLDDLLVGLMLRSGNDSAVAIAEHIAGTEQSFAELSTKRAKELGAKNTQFKNPHGLSAPGHYTTAYDLALLARHALLQLPRFGEIVSTREDTIDWDGRPYDRQLRNTNKLLWMFEGADGVKTGTTKEAGQCLVSSATRDGQQLISVVLHSGSRWNDSVRLLQYGFDNFTLLHFADKDAVHESLPVMKGMQECIDAIITEDVTVIVPKSQVSAIRVEFDLPTYVEAPVYRGQKIGEVTVFNKNQVIKVVDIVAGQEVLDRTVVRLTINHLTSLYRKLAGWGWF
jgi:D-alanyl-D-alanine carboxypeptidase (penicillin-binding protein 5/6)